MAEDQGQLLDEFEVSLGWRHCVKERERFGLSELVSYGDSHWTGNHTTHTLGALKKLHSIVKQGMMPGLTS